MGLLNTHRTKGDKSERNNLKNGECQISERVDQSLIMATVGIGLRNREVGQASGYLGTHLVRRAFFTVHFPAHDLNGLHWPFPGDKCRKLNKCQLRRSA